MTTNTIVIVRFDDSADFDDRVTFWNGRRFVREYPNATEYTARRDAKAALKKALDSGSAGTIAAITDYGMMTERVVTF